MRTQGDGGPDVQPPKSAIQETMTSGFYISVIVEVFFMFLCLYKMSNKLHQGSKCLRKVRFPVFGIRELTKKS